MSATTTAAPFGVVNVRPNIRGHKRATFDVRFGAVLLSGFELHEAGPAVWLSPPAGVRWTTPEAGRRVSNSVIGLIRRHHASVLLGEFRG